MSGKTTPAKRVALGLLVTGVALSAAAQDDAAGQNLGSARLSFGIESDDATNLTTGFGLNYDNQTRDQRLTIDIELAASAPVDDLTKTDFSSPQLALSYNRNNGAINMTLGATYSRQDVTGLVALDDSGSDIDLTDFVSDPGKSENIGGNVSLAFGQNDPLGTTFEYGFQNTKYIDTLSTELNDQQTRNLSLGFNLRVSSTVTVLPRYSITRSETEDSVNLSQQTERFDLGAEVAVSPVTDLSATVGLAEVSSSFDDGFGGRIEETNRQIEASIDLGFARPNGSAGLSYARTAEFSGATDRLTFSRNLELADTSGLNFLIGAASLPSGATTSLASLSYQHTLPNGSYSLNIRRDIDVSSNGDEAVVNRASGRYSLALTPNSDLSFAVNWADVDQLDTTVADFQRSDLSVQYDHELTPDWTLSAGATYRQSRETGAALSTENSLFVSLGRSFTISR